MAVATVRAAVVVVVVVVAGKDWCSAHTALSIVAQVDPVDGSSVLIVLELMSRARGGGAGGRGGGGGARSWSFFGRRW